MKVSVPKIQDWMKHVLWEMSTQRESTGDSNGEKAGPGSGSGDTPSDEFTKKWTIFRPYCMSPQTSTTSSIAPSVRDTLNAVKNVITAAVSPPLVSPVSLGTSSGAVTGVTVSMPLSIRVSLESVTTTAVSSPGFTTPVPLPSTTSGTTTRDVAPSPGTTMTATAPHSDATTEINSGTTTAGVVLSSGITTTTANSGGTTTRINSATTTTAKVGGPLSNTTRLTTFGNTTKIPASTNVPSVQQSTGTSSTSSEAKGGTTVSAGTSRAPRKWEQWSCTEINSFFEALKQFGKDIDQVARLLARRKSNKDKDQIRNYYFNSLKLLRSTARIDETLLADIPRDARELFILINGFEWKRKVCAKFDPAKFRQLIMDGSATVKIKKRKQVVVVRTPICPALQKFFPSCRSTAPPPSHIVLRLTPRTEADRCFVEQCGQNPFIQIRVAIGDQLRRIFTYLKMKWNIRARKLDEELTKEEEMMKLVLYPDKTTRIGKLVVKLYEATPMIFSLNRLKREQIQRRETTARQSSEPGKGRTTVAAAAFEEFIGREAEKSNATDDSDDGPFTISEQKLRNGLTEDIVKRATVTELYYVCGRETDIKLVYSTGVTRNSDPEPWRIFVNLLDRGYGDTLCKYLGDPQRMAELDHFAIDAKNREISAEKSRKRRKSTSNDAAESTDDARPSSKQFVNVVEEENLAFMEQLESLRVRKRAPSYHQRYPVKNIGIIQTDLRNPSPGHYLITPAVGHQTIVTIPAVVGSSSGKLSVRRVAAAPPTSQFSEVPGTARSRSAAGTTGQIRFSSTVGAIRPDDGQYIKEIDMTAKALIPFSEVNVMEGNAGSGGGGVGVGTATSAAVSNSALPEDVRNSVEMMLQQNSVDYCRNFEDFATLFDAPSTSVCGIHRPSQQPAPGIPVPRTDSVSSAGSIRSDDDTTTTSTAAIESDNGTVLSRCGSISMPRQPM